MGGWGEDQRCNSVTLLVHGPAVIAFYKQVVLLDRWSLQLVFFHCTNKILNTVPIIGVGMTCTLGGLIQYHVQFMCSKLACLIYDQANIGGGGAIAPPAPMVPTPMPMHLPVE